MVKAIDSEGLKTELPGMQRGKGEGGQMIEDNDSSHDPTIVPPAPIHARRRVMSLRWNEKFVIQPFHRSGGFLLIRQAHIVKTR